MGHCAAQFLLGFSAYFWPGFHKNNKEALLPWHHFLGRATFVLGLAAMAVRAHWPGQSC